jgi:Tfp pilus assembly protein PilF
MNERMRVALLLAVSLLVYGNTVMNSFAFDDDAYILHNPAVTNLSARGIFAPATTNSILRFFRPVTFGTYALNWAAGSMHPFGYHLFNLLLHALVTLLLFLVLKKLLENMQQGATIAFAAALLFAVHPIHAEAVAWIVGRAELLAAAFLLAAWLLHLQDRPIPVLACFFLALLSKESAIAFLPLALVGDYARGKLKPLSRYAWVAGVAALFVALLWKMQGGHLGEKDVNFLDNPLANLPAGLRILNALLVAWKYVGLHVYPATLSCDYSYNAIILYANWRHMALPAVAAALVLVLWIWAVWTRRGAWVLAGAIYLAGFAATANILVPTRTIMGERLAYLPSAGFCLLVALIWVRLENHQPSLAWAVLAILVAVLATRTVVRNRDWKDNFTLFSAAVQAVPGSAKMHLDLGGEYMKRDQLDEARREFHIALRIYPDYPEAMELYGLAESRTGHNQGSRQLLEKALSMTQKDLPDYDFRAVNLAAQLMKMGENEAALKLLNEEIVTSPGSPRAWSNRAVIRYGRGEMVLARTDAQNALRLDPTNTQAQNLLKLLSAPASTAPPH